VWDGPPSLRIKKGGLLQARSELRDRQTPAAAIRERDGSSRADAQQCESAQRRQHGNAWLEAGCIPSPTTFLQIPAEKQRLSNKSCFSTGKASTFQKRIRF